MGNDLHILVYVAPKTALLRGSIQAGRKSVRLTHTLLAILSPEEHEILHLYATLTPEDPTKSLVLSTDSYDEDGVKAGLAAAAAQRRAWEQAALDKKRHKEEVENDPNRWLTFDREAPVGRRWEVSEEVNEVFDYPGEMHFAMKAAAERNQRDWFDFDTQLLEKPVEDHIRMLNGRWHTLLVDANTPRAYARALARAGALNEAFAAEQKRQSADFLRGILSAEQWERHEAGVLANWERDDAIREHLFRTDFGLERYQRLELSDIKHAIDEDAPANVVECYEPVLRVRVAKHDTTEGIEMSPAEFANAKRVREHFEKHPQLVSITWCVHQAGCSTCEGDYTIRLGARVELSAHGRTYSVEYGL